MRLTTILFSSFILFTSVCLQAAEVNTFPPQQSAHIRTLAASCSACHGTNGNAVGGDSDSVTPVLAGLDAQYFIKRMAGFKSGERYSTVMHHHAKGLNITEIESLATYFSQQKIVVSTPPTAQTLKANHD